MGGKSSVLTRVNPNGSGTVSTVAACFSLSSYLYWLVHTSSYRYYVVSVVKIHHSLQREPITAALIGKVVGLRREMAKMNRLKLANVRPFLVTF